ncbi:HC-toxin efflux carrier TOXA [Penicillium bovifimosum]|uniref:HC-toxin efflux carrier TOXA n=1 Tax=Penicillium bovifimosum TaxID=126998 RepID=A0A9W9H0Y9_9EURO|nr:HC-toxin efflux carrier TOXA [Penicillium bovifimosum]KAJ5135403.1 HC-toxin efflux carrier TOXA [Penicillium bovifimosum]
MGSDLESGSDLPSRHVDENMPPATHSVFTEPLDGAGTDGSVTPEYETAAVKAVEQMSNLRWFGVCVGLYSTAFLYGLDSTIAASVQGPVLASLGNLNLLPWIGAGFMLGSVATISLFGSLYNKIEVKWLYLGSILTFEIGSAICGAAPNMSALAIGRVVAGIGGSGIYLGLTIEERGVNYISIFVSPAKRPLYTALIGTFWGLGAILGPVIGGAFAESTATWRWAFYINLVIGAVTSPIYILWFPLHGAHRHEPILPRIKTLDWLGALLNAAAFSLFVTSCTLSGSQWEWNSATVITLWVMTGVVVLAFALQQGTAFLTTKEDRIFPVWCLKSRSLVLLFIGTVGTSAVLNVDIYYLPLYFEFTAGMGSMEVAVRLLPFVCLIIFGTMLSGALLPKYNLYAAWYTASGAIAVVGGALLVRIDTATPTSHIYGFSVLAGFGCGLTFQAAYAIALVKAPMEKASSVLSFINVAQLGGAALSLAIAGSVFHNVGFNTMQGALGGRGFTSAQIHDALAGGDSPIISNSDPEVHAIASDAIASTLGKVYVLSTVAAAAILVAGLLMRWEKVKMA